MANIGTEPLDDYNKHARRILKKTSAAVIVVIAIERDGAANIAAAGYVNVPPELLIARVREALDKMEADLKVTQGKPS